MTISLLLDELFKPKDLVDWSLVLDILHKNEEAVRWRDDDGETVLHIAAGAKCAPFAVVQEIYNLWPGAVDEAETVDFCLPLHWACIHCRQVEVIQLFIERVGIENLQVKDDYEEKLPLHLACERGQPVEVVQLLIERGGHESLKEADSEGQLPLHSACAARQSLDVIQLLIDRGGIETLHVKNNDGQLPLHGACAASQTLDIIRMLIDRGGQETVHVKDENGRLPLHAICLYGRQPLDTIQLLIERGGIETVQVKDSMGQLPLHSACCNGYQPLDVIEFLMIQNPQATRIANNYGFLPVGVAEQLFGRSEIVRWFEEREAKLERANAIYPHLRVLVSDNGAALTTLKNIFVRMANNVDRNQGSSSTSN